MKSNENKQVDFRHLQPLCDGWKAAGARVRGLLDSTRNVLPETEMLMRVAIERNRENK